MAVQQFRKHALMMRVQMLDDNESEPGWNVSRGEHFAKGFKTAC
jgi:hypothetical protein